MLTRTIFQDMLAASAPGDAIIYHVGVLMLDRQQGQDFGRVHATADAAWSAHEAGTVILCQRKLGPGKYEYLAVKRRDPAKV